MFAFYPFADTVICARCEQPVSTREGVGVWINGVPEGIVHEECPK